MKLTLKFVVRVRDRGEKKGGGERRERERKPWMLRLEISTITKLTPMNGFE